MTTKSINELLTQYEAGSLTRRELLAAITLLAQRLRHRRPGRHLGAGGAVRQPLPGVSVGGRSSSARMGGQIRLTSTVPPT